ncbi:endonuclease/exonuclease/phosphatase family protein [Actinomycetospora soli]|uniref:endonuclease/exonuclease/phosphatase family protein n=1 Tax=Actinomycetospora soli TaxID=2893887 RepID=UPI001E4D947A|nr:endonuclease/exonuclease/phosphatase family protein [Actinomycetospora soli]MCD2185623.1 endonuclease/exonuclease/phosphatase family protein [Actinomycetospora soli]
MRRSLPAVLGAVVGLALALAVLLPGYVGLDRVTPFVQLAALTPLLLVVVMVSAFVGRFAGVLVRRKGPPLDERRPRLFAAGFAALVAAALVALTTAGIVGSRLLADDAPVGSRGPTVLTLNTDRGRADVDALAALVRERAADVVVLPEAGNLYRARLTALLPDYRGWSADAPSPDDAASTSLLLGPRVPAPQIRSVPGRLFGTLDATVSGVRIVAVHVAAPVPPGQVGLWRDDLARLVAPACGSRPASPTIVAGDLNATADHSVLRAATAGCTDALPSVGSGTVATYPTDLPRWFGLQIDHVLVGGGLGVADAEVLDVPGSDHRAVLARLVVG